MSIDLLPFHAFALESCAVPATAGEARTITLSLRPARAAAPWAGRLSVQRWEPAAAEAQRSGIRGGDAAPLTISFR